MTNKKKTPIRFLISGFFGLLITTSVAAEEVSFVCYNELLQKDGLYESKGGVRAIPIELTFDPANQTVRRSGWNCTVQRWSDPNIFFTCSRFDRVGRFVLAANIFSRHTARLAMESVGELDFSDFLNDFEPGEMHTVARQKTYDQCQRKQF